MDYRQKVYDHYVTTSQRRLSPSDVGGFEERAPCLGLIIRRHFPHDRESAILELGCGHGAFTHFNLQAGYCNVMGVDISAEQVNEAHRLGIENIYRGDLLEAIKQMPSESWDVVIAYDVIEHFTKDELMPFGEEVMRVMRPGGKWILHTPNGEGLFGMRAQYWDYTHMTGFTRNSLTQFLRTVGLSQVSCYEDRIVTHGIKSALRLAVWTAVRFGLRVILAAETGDAKKSLHLNPEHADDCGRMRAS